MTELNAVYKPKNVKKARWIGKNSLTCQQDWRTEARDRNKEGNNN